MPNCTSCKEECRGDKCRACYTASKSTKKKNEKEFDLRDILCTQDIDLDVTSVPRNDNGRLFSNLSYKDGSVVDIEYVITSNYGDNGGSEATAETFSLINLIKSVGKRETDPLLHEIADLKKANKALKDEIQSIKGSVQHDSSASTLNEQPKKMKEIKETMELQNKAVHQQQIFLEHLANKVHRNNLVLTGIPEGDDDPKCVEELFRAIVPDESIQQNQDFELRQLGNNETARKPRPLLLQFHNHSTAKRKKMLQNKKKLKDIEQHKKIFIKPDQHPVFRKEHSRLAKVAWEERKKPGNRGCNIIYDRKEGVVKKDNVIIDHLSIIF